MFRQLSRIIAVVILASAPLVGGSVAQAASRDAWPVYPSMYSVGCQINGLQMACGPGGLLQSQFNSGYQCNEIDVSENGYGSGPILLNMTVDDQSISQSITIDGDGDWYVQFPGFLVNNLVSLEFSTPDGAVFILPTIISNPCPVATTTPTAAATNTPNPSDTPTATINPAYTVTPIPTFTPLPSGHSTFTATRTPTASPTGGPTSTPPPPTGDCGGPDFPLLNCPWFGGGVGAGLAPAPHWTRGYSSANCAYNTSSGGLAYTNTSYAMDDPPFSGSTDACIQAVTPGAAGTLYAQYRYTPDIGGSNTALIGFCVTSGCSTDLNGTSCPVTGGSDCTIPVSSVAVGGTTSFTVRMAPVNPSASGLYLAIDIDHVFVSTTGDTPTPVSTGTPTNTPVGPTSTITNTPISIPGAHETPIPADTECPGGCAVTDLTAIPGLSTVVTVDTNPFSPLTHLSLTRSSCQPFGYVQIPIPVITGTPALGQPLQFGWTAPITHTWDDTHLITNTAIQPCAMVGEVSPYVWDFTYWGSGVALAIVFTIWLIGWVGRLSGDHTING